MISPPEFYNLLSDQTRLRCLILLTKKEKLCVCELMHALGSSQPKISRHLSMMRNAGVLVDERRGQWVYYCLNPLLPDWMHSIIAISFEKLKIIEPYHSDIKQMQTLDSENICKK